MARQDQSSSDVTFTRSDLGQFASLLFGFMLLMAVLAFIWEGRFEPYIGALAAISVMSLIAWVMLTPQEFRDFITGRQARRGTISVFSTFLFTGIIVMVYVFVERQVITFDLTEAGSFTLDSTTTEVLERLNPEVDIRITAFFEPQYLALQELDDQIWRQYEVETDGVITRAYIDPLRQPNVAEAFNADNGDVYVSYLDESGNVQPETIMKVRDSIIDEGEAPPAVTTSRERDMTLAISRLMARGNFVAYYAAGHGEFNPNDVTASGLNTSVLQLYSNGWDIKLLDLRDLAANDQDVPADASVVIIPGPREAYEAGVVSVLDRYLDNGGSLFIMANGGAFLQENSVFNDYLWTNWGLRMRDAIVVDFRSETSPLDAFSAQVFDSPITVDINTGGLDTTLRFPRARVIEVNDTPPVPNGRAVMSSDASYGETDIETLGFSDAYEFVAEEDLPGPHTLVAFAADQETGGRVLLVGDADFLTEGAIIDPPGNALLFVNGLDYLTDFDETISFGFDQRAFGLPTIELETRDLDQINYVVFIFVPGLILFMGTVVWFRRSRR